ncbi:MAG: TIGR03557 family F420-dependent LLM class oxidoreductase [Microthrixaceae bacterium]
MTDFGYVLSSEEHGPTTLVTNATRAEAAGFEYLSVSDHYHPWVQAQGHSPFVWTLLGALAQATDRVRVGVGVTCPIIRIHPAVIAQAAATTSLLFDGRFFLGLGTGEALNEHVLGDKWPTPELRRSMLVEAIDVLRQLWTGETVDHHGEHYTVENARLFDPPSDPIPLILSAFGPDAAEHLAGVADGYWGTSPDADLVQAYRDAGGSGPRYAELTVCWSEDEEDGRATVHEHWPNSGLPGQLAQDLQTWTHFEQATSVLSMDQTTEHIPCGPGVQPFVEQVRTYLDAGFDHLHFHQIGDDQEGFLRFWTDELRPAL